MGKYELVLFLTLWALGAKIRLQARLIWQAPSSAGSSGWSLLSYSLCYFLWKRLCLDFSVKKSVKKITLGPIPTTFTIKWFVHVFSELNSPQSIFSIPLPCQLCNPFPVFLVVTLVTSLGWMLNPIQRELTIFFQVVQMFWSPPPPHSFSKDQWLCTCGVRTALAMFSLLECLQTRTPEL